MGHTVDDLRNIVAQYSGNTPTVQAPQTSTKGSTNPTSNKHTVNDLRNLVSQFSAIDYSTFDTHLSTYLNDVEKLADKYGTSHVWNKSDKDTLSNLRAERDNLKLFIEDNADVFDADVYDDFMSTFDSHDYIFGLVDSKFDTPDTPSALTTARQNWETASEEAEDVSWFNKFFNIGEKAKAEKHAEGSYLIGGGYKNASNAVSSLESTEQQLIESKAKIDDLIKQRNNASSSADVYIIQSEIMKEQDNYKKLAELYNEKEMQLSNSGIDKGNVEAMDNLGGWGRALYYGTNELAKSISDTFGGIGTDALELGRGVAALPKVKQYNKLGRTLDEYDDGSRSHITQEQYDSFTDPMKKALARVGVNNAEDYNVGIDSLKEVDAYNEEQMNQGLAGEANALLGEARANQEEVDTEYSKSESTIGNGIVKLFYESAPSIAGMAFDGAMAKGLDVDRLVSMGLRVYGTTKTSALNQGNDEESSTLYGLSHAAIEVGSELLGNAIGGGSLGEKFFNNSINQVTSDLAKNGIFLNMLKDMAEEGGEEVLAELLDPFAEAILSSDYGKALVEEYGQQTAMDYINAFAGGALVSMLGGGKAYLSKYEGDTQALIDEAKQYGDASAQKYAEKLQTIADKGKFINNYQATKITNAIDNAYTRQDVDTIANYAQDYLAELGEDKANVKAQSIAEALVSSAESGKTIDEAIDTFKSKNKNLSENELEVLDTLKSNPVAEPSKAMRMKSYYDKSKALGTIKTDTVRFGNQRVADKLGVSVEETNQVRDAVAKQIKKYSDAAGYNLTSEQASSLAIDKVIGDVENARQYHVANDSEKLTELSQAVGENAGAVVGAYREGQMIDDYVAGMNLAINVLAANGASKEIIKSATACKVLTDLQIERAYDIGHKKYLDSKAEAKKKAEELKKSRDENAEITKGTVSLEGGTITDNGKEIKLKAVDKSKLNEEQNAFIDTISEMSEFVNYNVVVFDGDAKGIQGVYKGGNTLYVNINAGQAAKEMFAGYAMSHELTHSFKENAPEEYEELKDFIVNELMKVSPDTFEDMVREEMNRGSGLSYEGAVDEVIANGCQDMLGNTKALEKLHQKNSPLFNKVREFLAKIKAKWNKVFNKGEALKTKAPYSVVKYLDEQALGDAFAKKLELWDKCFMQAMKNIASAQLKAKGIDVNSPTLNADIVESVLGEDVNEPISMEELNSNEEIAELMDMANEVINYDSQIETIEEAEALNEEVRAEAQENLIEAAANEEIDESKIAEIVKKYDELVALAEEALANEDKPIEIVEEYKNKAPKLAKRWRSTNNKNGTPMIVIGEGTMDEFVKSELQKAILDPRHLHIEIADANHEHLGWLFIPGEYYNEASNAEELKAVLEREFQSMRMGMKGMVGVSAYNLQKYHVSAEEFVDIIVEQINKMATADVPTFSAEEVSKGLRESLRQGYEEDVGIGYRAIYGKIDVFADDILSTTNHTYTVSYNGNKLATFRSGAFNDALPKILDILMDYGYVEDTRTQFQTWDRNALSFNQQLDDYLNPKSNNTRDNFIVGATPEIWQKIGLAALPVSINESHVSTALNGIKNGVYDEDHNVGERLLRQLPQAIKHPVAIIKSDSRSNDSIVVVLKLLNPINQKQIIAPVNINGNGYINSIEFDTNKISSFFGKSNIIQKLYDTIVNENNGKASIYWINKKETIMALNSVGLQLSNTNVPSGFVHTVAEIGPNVNHSHSNIINTKQFIRWFGDWETEKDKSSKIVDENGKPLIIYHGSSEKNIKEFRTKNQWNNGGLYLATNKSVAESFGKSGKVYPVYANIRNPFMLDVGSKRYDSIPANLMPAEFLNNSKYYFGSNTIDTQEIAAWVRNETNHDGVWIKNVIEADQLTDDIIAFEPNQIKSIYNIGTFNSDTNNIYHQNWESVDDKYKSMSYAEIGKLVQENSKQLQSVRAKISEATNNPEYVKASEELSDLISNHKEVARLSNNRTDEEKAEAKRKVDDKRLELTEIQNKLGIKELNDKRYELESEYNELRKASDYAYYREGTEREQKAIADSGLTEQEYFNKKSLNEFGITTNFREAGYLLPDGKMLNFSGDKGQHLGFRGNDHRSIGAIFEVTDYTDAMNRFIALGNVRIMAESPGIDLPSNNITDNQYAQIKRMISTIGKKEGEFYVDFSDANGNTIGSYEYADNINADKIISDIKYFYENGTVREESSIMQFHNMYQEWNQPENGKAIRKLLAGTEFSGGGTVDFALSAIIDSQFAVEYEDKIAAVFKQNNKTTFMGKNVYDFDAKQYAGKLDYFHASPVCKSFSLAINADAKARRLASEDDMRAAQKVAHDIETIKPPYFTLENVPQYKGTKYAKVITDTLQRNGYKWDDEIYNAADFGAATTRERLIIRAVKNGELPPVIKKTVDKHTTWYETVEDLIDTLPTADTNPRMIESLLQYNNIDVNNINKPLFVFGESYKNKQYGHAFADSPVPTIIANSGASRIFMPDGRVLEATPRVLARITGLPDNYRLDTGKVNARTIIGNGVPVKLTQGVIGSFLNEVTGQNVQFQRWGDNAYWSSNTLNNYIKNTRYGENKSDSYVVRMNLEDFLSLTTTSKKSKELIKEDAREKYSELDTEKLSQSEERETGIILYVDTSKGSVIGHEGRHRASLMLDSGIKTAPIRIIDRAARYNDKAIIPSLTLKAQRFNDKSSRAKVDVENLIPITEKFRAELEEAFTNNTDEGVLQYQKWDAEHPALVAVHNKSVSGLKRMLERGGVPFPSIAIKKAGANHEGFGDVSIVFSRATVDPEASEYNKIYSNDAWTPTEPHVEYDVDTKSVTAELKNLLGEDIYNGLQLNLYLKSDYLATLIHNAEGNLTKAIGNLLGIKYAYLKSKGQAPSIPKRKRTLDNYNDEGPALDYDALRSSYEISELNTSNADYTKWIHDTFDNVIADSGIYNDSGIYDSRGNRRTFKQTHVPATMDNIIKQMRKQQETGNGAAGTVNLRGAATKSYDSVDEARAESGKLLGSHIADEEYDAIMMGFYSRLTKLTEKAQKVKTDYADGSTKNILLEVIRDSKSKADMLKRLNRNSKWIDSSLDLANDLWQLKQDVQNMPAPYFEAKPRRFVGLDEALAVIVPDNIDKSMLDEMRDKGVKYVTYEANNQADRLDKLNKVEGAKFQTWSETKGDTKIEQKNRDLARDRLAAEVNTLREQFEAIKKVNKELTKALEKSQKDTKKAKAQVKPSAELAREDDVKKLANKYAKEYGVDVEEILPMFQKFADMYIMSKNDPNSIDWIEWYQLCTDIGQYLVDNANVLVDDFQKDMREDLKARLKQTLVVPQLNRGDFNDGYNEFRKRNLGIIHLGNQGLAIDSFYMELQDSYGKGIFPDVNSGAEMAETIVDVYRNAEPTYGNPYEGYEDEAKMAIANDVMDDITADAVRRLPKTFADKALEKQIDKVAKMQTRLDNLRKAKNDRIEEVKRFAQARLEEQIAKEKADKWERVEAVRNFYKEREKTAREKRKGRDYIARINKVINSLNSRLKNPTEAKHIPKEFVQETIDILNMIDRDTGKNVTLQNELAKLQLVYDRYKKDEKYAMVYDESTADMLKNLALDIGTTPLNKMNNKQLELTYKTLTALLHTIDTANSIFINGQEINAYEMSVEMTNETRDAVVPKKLLQDYTQVMLKPADMFDLLAGHKKNSAWNDVSQMFRDAEVKEHGIIMDLSTGFADLINDSKNLEKFISYKDKDLVDIGLKDKNGNAIKVTHGFMCSIYMDLLNEDNRRHLMYTGKIIPDFKEYYHHKDGNGFGQKEKWAVGISGDYIEVRNKLYEAEARGDTAEQIILQEQLDELNLVADTQAEQIKKNIENQMTDYDKKFVKATQELMDVKSKQYINDTTMEVYGIEKAIVDNYFPIIVSKDFLSTPFESVVKDGSLENVGFLKERIQSRKPTLAMDISDIVNRQIQNVSQYCGMMPAIRSFNKIYGKVQAGYNDSLKHAIDNKFGTSALRYIDNLLGDLNGSRKADNEGLGKLLSTLRGNLAPAVLTLNIRVALSQTASYPTAAAKLGWKPIAKAFFKGGKKDTIISRADKELIAKYSPELWYRMQGYSSIELGNIKESVQVGAKIWRKLNFLTGWIQAFDGATVGRLWYACQYYVEENMPDLKYGSEEYYRAVAEKYNEVITTTQPVYSTFERPALLRSHNELVKSFTMFMTQRLQNFNITFTTASKYAKYRADYAKNRNGVTKADVNDARDELIHTSAAMIAQGATLTIFKFLADLIMHNMNGYRDDDDELTAESVGWKLLDMFIDAEIGCLFLGSELYSIFKAAIGISDWYGLSVNGVGTLEDLIEDFISITPAKEPKFSDFLTFGVDITQAMGLPIENGYKIGKAFWSHFQDIRNGEFGSFEFGVERTDKQNASILLDAMDEGDEEKIDNFTDKFETKDQRLNALKGVIKERYQDGEMDYDEAVEKLVDLDIVFDEAEADKMIYNWDNVKSNASLYDPIADAIDANDVDAFESKKEELIAHGYEDSDIYSAVKSKIKEDYLDYLTIDKETAINELLTYTDMDKEDVDALITKWTCKRVTGIDYEDIGDYYMAYLNGNTDKGIDEKTARNMMRTYGGMEREDINEDILHWQLEAKTGIKVGSSTDGIKSKVLSGEISESEASKMMQEYDGQTRVEANRYAAQYVFERDTGYKWTEAHKALEAGAVTEEELLRWEVKCNKSAHGSKVKAAQYVEVEKWKINVPEFNMTTYTNYLKSQKYIDAENLKYGDISKVITFYNGAESDFDADGESIDYSKAAKVAEYVNGMDLTSSEKTCLMEFVYSYKTVKKVKLW